MKEYKVRCQEIEIHVKIIELRVQEPKKRLEDVETRFKDMEIQVEELEMDNREIIPFLAGNLLADILKKLSSKCKRKETTEHSSSRVQ